VRSVKRAMELGVDGIEIDVQLCEGRLVVLHDATVNRTTNGRGRLSRKTFEALRTLDAGKGEPVPTIEEVLDAVDRRVFVNIELKGANTAAPVEETIERYVREKGWRHEDFLVSSFHHKALLSLAGARFPIGILFSRWPHRFATLAEQIGASAIHMNVRFVRLKIVEKIHAHGLRLFVYTVNKPADLDRMRRFGVDGVFTDFPDRV